METLSKVDYAQVVKDALLKELEGGFEYDDVKHKVVFDDEHKTYLLLTVGQQDGKAVYFVSIAVQLTDEGKVKIEWDRTDYNVVGRLIENGVEARDII